MIWNVLALSAIRLLFRTGLAPRSLVIRRSLSSLKSDDLTSAVNLYFEAAGRDFSSEKVEVLREILVSEIKFRKQVMEKRSQELSGDASESTASREIAACYSAVEVLDGFLQRLGADLATQSDPEE